uniref:Uncharacterized protein n=1 Tax=Romanomermis culicivorax TaxID=13658 RepID=A0A915IIJ6_ROMCU
MINLVQARIEEFVAETIKPTLFEMSADHKVDTNVDGKISERIFLLSVRNGKIAARRSYFLSYEAVC